LIYLISNIIALERNPRTIDFQAYGDDEPTQAQTQPKLKNEQST
jgi:hypothetical protein